MPWIRLDDDYIYHPKFKALSHAAFRLWHEGMAYCRKLQTDGAIPSGALKGFSYASRPAIAELTSPLREGSAALWEVTGGGYAVHDYLQWNASKEVETARKAGSRERMQKSRALRVTDGATESATSAATGDERSQNVRTEPVLVTARSSKQRKEIQINARSKWPVHKGQRFVVFDWQLEDICRMLGEYADDFGLDEWFQSLDQMCVGKGLVAPDRDGGEWLKEQTLLEAQRRGIPIRRAQMQKELVSAPTQRIMSAVEQIRAEEAAKRLS